ncbi:MAG: hypothetical protein M0Z60_01345, partial [Nitrospiraceae bacterium]|nr:hypothetical protein [Nitrospiraceae bacterium]
MPVWRPSRERKMTDAERNEGGLIGRAGHRGVFRRYPGLWAFLAFVCLALYALGANPFGGQTIGPFDLLLSYPGWSSVHPDRTVLNSQPSDIVDSLLPVWIGLKEQIRQGRGALWYPYGAGGEPVSLELCNPAFLLFLAVRDNALAFYLVGLAKLVISGFGGYLLLRVFLRWLPSVWGGMVYMLCGFNTAWFYWDQVTTAMWIPWLLWATVMYLRTEELKWLPAVSVISLLLICGEFPSVAAFGFYSFSLLLFVWLLCDHFGGRREGAGHAERVTFEAKKAALPLMAVGAAFVMSAAALVPFADNMRAINLGYRAGGGTSFGGLRDLLLFLDWEKPLKVERTAYIGILPLVLALPGALAVFGAGGRKSRRFIAYNILLVAVTMAIIFNVLPDRVIRAIPVFNSNHWSRLIVITLLGLAVLSSFGLECICSALSEALCRLKLDRRHAMRAGALAAVMVSAFQFHAQKDFFSSYVAVVPSSWFYPLTPSILYVKERLMPLESVIADNSFMVSGTLGAYGIPEWYAHAFRTDREKEVLGRIVLDPFASPTAAFIDGSRIQFDSPLMDRLAIKYLLLYKGVMARRMTLSLPEAAPVTAPPLPENSWRQRIDIPEGMTVTAIGFRFGTYGAERAPDGVRLTLYNDEGQRYSLEPVVGRDGIRDNQWSYFEFPSGTDLRKGVYTVVLSLTGDEGKGRLTAWATRSALCACIACCRASANATCAAKRSFFETNPLSKKLLT